MEIARQKRAPVGIDMSPLIDCVFQLLIFFMLSSSFMTPMIQLKLPQATTGQSTENQDILLSVDEEGRWYINTKQVSAEELKPELRALIAQSKHKAVTFRGDEKMRYELFVKAVDTARSCGAAHINIAHRQP